MLQDMGQRNTDKSPPELHSFLLRLPKPLHAEVVELAEKRRRSVTSQLLIAVEEHVERERAAA